MLLSPERFADLDARHTRNQIYWAVHADYGRGGASSLSADADAAMPPECRISNAERGELELHAFMVEAPARLFCYVARDISTGVGNPAPWKCVAWPGQSYGRAIVGPSYAVPAHGRRSRRRAVTLYAVNGWVYSGTLYESSGDYARLRRTKRRHSAPQA